LKPKGAWLVGCIPVAVLVALLSVLHYVVRNIDRKPKEVPMRKPAFTRELISSLLTTLWAMGTSAAVVALPA
jgi:hypothetical protein